MRSPSARLPALLVSWSAGFVASAIVFVVVMAPEMFRQVAAMQLLVPFVGSGVAVAVSPRSHTWPWLALVGVPAGFALPIFGIVLMLLSDRVEPTLVVVLATLGYALLATVAGGWVGLRIRRRR